MKMLGQSRQFTQKSKHLCKVRHWYEAVSLLVEHPERLPDLLLYITIVDLSDDKE